MPFLRPSPRLVSATTSRSTIGAEPTLTGPVWPSRSWRPWARAGARPLPREQAQVLAVAALVLIAAAFRCYDLGASGFSEDEVNKVNEVRAYERLDFSANAEHPMMMKVAMLASTAGGRAWNRTADARGWPQVSPEAALRLPNALAGAATVIPLFLLARSFFGPAAALWTSCFFALDVNATGINRIGKEDSLLLLFLLLGAWCYEQARARQLRGGTSPDRWYVASGAAFGLMLASKYMPYYLGLWAVFGLAAQDGRSWQHASRWFYAAMLVAFLLANPAVLLPATWRYVAAYAGGATITHHGMFYSGRVYPNTVDTTPWGLPWSYYLRYLVTKIPTPLLAAIGLGVAELVRRRRERGAVFARVMLVLFLLPASLVASKFVRYLLPALAVLDVVAALGVVRALDLMVGAGWSARARTAAGVLVAAVMVGAPLMAQVSSAPHYSLFQNAMGERLAAPGRTYPDDELYDTGMREAVSWIAERARPGAALASDAPGVVAEYLRRANRPDLEARSLSMEGLSTPPTEAWLLAQDSHSYFESLPVIEQVRRRRTPDFVYRVWGTPAVEVFRMPW